MPQYHKAAKLSDISNGEAKEVEVDGEIIALYNVDGKIYATTNECPHQQGPLGQGMLENGTVTCPWHGWKFNVKSGINQMIPTLKIQTFPVKIEGDDILVCVG